MGMFPPVPEAVYAMKMIRKGWLPLSLAAMLASGANATLADVTPKQLIEQTTGEFLNAVAHQRAAILESPGRAEELVNSIVMPYIDVDTVGRWMLGKHWREATADQRQRFVDALRGMLVRSYATALADYTRGDQIKYLSERVSDDGTTALVRTQIPRLQGPQSADVVYRLHRKADGWKIYDVTIEGVSVVITYRNTFLSKIERQGLEGVIQELAALNRKN